MSCLLITECDIATTSLGRQRRDASLAAWAEGAAAGKVAHVSVLAAEGELSRFRRTMRVIGWRPPAWHGRRPVLILSALAAPHMVVLGLLLSRRHRVVIDVCDSWLLLARAQASQGSPRCLVSLATWMVLRFLSGRCLLAYISDRDANADRFPPSLHRSFVIPQIVAEEQLLGLKPVAYPLSRIVVAFDPKSLHNRRGTSRYLPALAEWADRDGVSLEVFGGIPAALLPPGVSRAAWVDNLVDVYTGDTAVFVTNVAGSGIPNKVLEASAAGRPLIMHESLTYLLPYVAVPVWLFRSAESIGEASSACVNGRPAVPSNMRPAAEPCQPKWSFTCVEAKL